MDILRLYGIRIGESAKDKLRKYVILRIGNNIYDSDYPPGISLKDKSLLNPAGKMPNVYTYCITKINSLNSYFTLQSELFNKNQSTCISFKYLNFIGEVIPHDKQ